jgi:hypothetical protein
MWTIIHKTEKFRDEEWAGIYIDLLSRMGGRHSINKSFDGVYYYVDYCVTIVNWGELILMGAVIFALFIFCLVIV